MDLEHTYDEDPHLTSRFYVKYSGGAPSVADCNTLALAVSSAWDAHLVNLPPADVALVGVVVTDLTSPSAHQGTWAGSITGTRSGAPMSINDVVNLGFKIDRRYRGGKPKMYGPWGVVTDLDTRNTWTSGFVSAVNSDWGDFMSYVLASVAGTTTLTDQVNVSYYEGFASVQNPVTMRWRNIPTPRPAAVIDVITAHACSPTVSSQRRRLRVS